MIWIGNGRSVYPL